MTALEKSMLVAIYTPHVEDLQIVSIVKSFHYGDGVDYEYYSYLVGPGEQPRLIDIMDIGMPSRFENITITHFAISPLVRYRNDYSDILHRLRQIYLGRPDPGPQRP